MNATEAQQMIERSFVRSALRRHADPQLASPEDPIVYFDPDLRQGTTRSVRAILQSSVTGKLVTLHAVCDTKTHMYVSIDTETADTIEAFTTIGDFEKDAIYRKLGEKRPVAA